LLSMLSHVLHKRLKFYVTHSFLNAKYISLLLKLKVAPT
jgi:hypothetical protein